MKNNCAKRLFVGLVVGFFLGAAIILVGCAPKKVKVVYEN